MLYIGDCQQLVCYGSVLPQYVMITLLASSDTVTPMSAITTAAQVRSKLAAPPHALEAFVINSSWSLILSSTSISVK